MPVQAEDHQLDEADQPLPRFDIRREGRAWTADEAMNRIALLGDFKIEVIDGKLLWTEHDRLLILGLLLENVGLDATLRLGDLETWRAALAALSELELRVDDPCR